MIKIQKEDILVPLLEGYYGEDWIFYEQFYNLILEERPIYLPKPFGLSLIITNFADKEKTKFLINVLEKNENFISTLKDGDHYHMDNMDENLFEEKSRFSFERSVFKSNKLIKVSCIEFSLFISFAQFKDIDKSIISFIFTTWNKNYFIEDTYVSLSNIDLINLIPTNLKDNTIQPNDLIKRVWELDKTISEFLNINRNTFFGVEFWRKDWNDKQDNLINAMNYIRANPYYFYSLINFDKDIYRRNFKNIMDSLGWCFSASRVHCGIFSKKIYVSVSSKPKKERFDLIGHDGTEFKAWEILGLQNFLLDQIDKEYREYYHNRHKEHNIKLEKLIDELHNVYDVSAIFGKKKKGDIWIKFNKYAQDQIGISSNYELYENRSQRLLNEAKETTKSNLIAFINLILSSLVLVTIFISIIAIYLNNSKLKYAGLFQISSEISNFLLSSLIITPLLSGITVLLFYIFFKYMYKNFFRHRKIF
jgi:hypothetical protein